MLASIIIDNYNYGRFLREAIDSALAQTYPGKEVIVVDDGSTDDSRAIVASYGRRIRGVLKENGGQASALNAGFVVSRGDVVFFLDSDDTLTPSAVEKALALFDHGQVVKVHWPLQVVDADGRPQGRTQPAQRLPEGDFAEAILRGGPTSCISSPTSGNAWSRAFLEKVLPIPETLNYYKRCADEYLFTLAPVFGGIRALHEPQGTYRIHGRNMYAARPFAERLPIEIAGHAEQCEALSGVLRRHGFDVDVAAWKRHSWFGRLQQSLAEIEALVPREDAFVLIDDGTWEAHEIFPGGRARPLVEREGEDWGPPANDAAAIEQLSRQRQSGARFIIFAWSAFWWLDHYQGFGQWLDSGFPCVLKNDRLVIYDLRSPPRPRGKSWAAAAGSWPFPAEAAFKASADVPLASIVINNYNYAHFLKEAIESALNQTHPRVEVIVVDDGSTDHSREVMTGFGERIIPVGKENGGQGSAYNAGWPVSRGDLVCFLDADDTLFPHAVSTMVRCFQEPGTVKVQWPMAITDKAGKRTGELSAKQKPPDGDLRERISREGPIYDFLFHTGSAYTRGFLDRVFPVPEPPYRNGADVYLITLAPAFGQLRTAPEPLGTYRSHGANHYWGRALDEERLRNYVRRFDTNCAMLAGQMARLGAAADPELWKQRNFNSLWPRRLLAARQDLAALLPAGSKYILVNQNEWGDGEPVVERHAIPFLERDGEYFGPPSDDVQALAELERLRRHGARYIVFWWTAFWWFEHYAGFHARLRDTFRCVLNNEQLLVFDLERPVP